MGITGLAKLIADIAPNSIKESEIKNHFGKLLTVLTHLCHISLYVHYGTLLIAGRKIAIDASMSLYQFLIAVRSEGAQLTSADGETTRYVYNIVQKVYIV